MKKYFVIFLIIGLLQLISCSSEDKPAGPTTPSDSLLVSGIITDSGGEFGNDDFILTIAAGAFNSDTELALYETSANPNDNNTGCTKNFMLEGLPEVLLDTVKIKLRYEGSLSDSSYIVVGYAAFNEGTDSALIVNRYLTCSDSGGYLSAELSEVFGGSFRKENPFNKPYAKNALVYVKGVTTMMEVQTDNEHFQLIYPIYYDNIVIDLEEYLEEAYQEFQSVQNYEYAMVKPPGGVIDHLKVEVRSFSQFEEERHNKYVINLTTYTNNVNGYDFYLIVNERYFKSEYTDKFKSAVYQEFFKIVQEAHIKTDYAQDKWFHEATAMWMGGEYKNSPPKVSDYFAGNEMAPFNGFNAGASFGHKEHGQGMTAFIEFLMRDQGSYSNLRLIYNQLRTGISAMDAIIQTLEDEPFDWITEFYQKYISATFTNSNYDVSASVFTASSNLAGTININSAEDKEQSFNTNIAEGGAKLFKINLSPEIFGEKTASINLETVSDDVDLGDLQIIVFEFDNNQLNFLTQGLTVKITNLEDFTDDLYVAIVNTSLTSPSYDHTANVKFNTEVKVSDATFDYTTCSVYTNSIDGTFLRADGSNFNSGTGFTYWTNKGSFDGHYFHDDDEQGKIEIWVNTESMVIDSLHASSEATYLGGIIQTEIKTETIPLYKIEGEAYYFKVTGYPTCETIKSLSEELIEWGQNNYTLESYNCNSESFLMVILY